MPLVWLSRLGWVALGGVALGGYSTSRDIGKAVKDNAPLIIGGAMMIALYAQTRKG